MKQKFWQDNTVDSRICPKWTKIEYCKTVGFAQNFTIHFSNRFERCVMQIRIVRFWPVLGFRRRRTERFLWGFVLYDRITNAFGPESVSVFFSTQLAHISAGAGSRTQNVPEFFGFFSIFWIFWIFFKTKQSKIELDLIFEIKNGFLAQNVPEFLDFFLQNGRIHFLKFYLEIFSRRFKKISHFQKIRIVKIEKISKKKKTSKQFWKKNFEENKKRNRNRNRNVLCIFFQKSKFFFQTNPGNFIE